MPIPPGTHDATGLRALFWDDAFPADEVLYHAPKAKGLRYDILRAEQLAVGIQLPEGVVISESKWAKDQRNPAVMWAAEPPPITVTLGKKGCAIMRRYMAKHPSCSEKTVLYHALLALTGEPDVPY